MSHLQAIGKIDNSMLFPIPFQYFHVVNVVLKLDLLLLAYAFLFIGYTCVCAYACVHMRVTVDDG